MTDTTAELKRLHAKRARLIKLRLRITAKINAVGAEISALAQKMQ